MILFKCKWEVNVDTLIEAKRGERIKDKHVWEIKQELGSKEDNEDREFQKKTKTF